jgi:hypothetical protein
MFSMAKITSTATQLISLKVTLQDIQPPIWRRLMMPGEATLGTLHWAIQSTMGWENCHLHRFDIAKRVYGDPIDVDGVTDEDRLTLNDVVRLRVARFIYTYDFGDDWRHLITVESKKPAIEGRTYPTCIAGERNCPPEDCGGCWGYEELLAALANPKHPSYDHWIEMIGDDFEPEKFSVDDADALLAAQFRVQ